MAWEKDYEVLATLGEGSFGKVYKARHRQSDDVVAVKQIKLGSKSWEDAMKSTELQALRTLRHPYVVKLRELLRSQRDGILYYVFEFVSGDLYKFMKQYPNGLAEPRAAELTRQILVGLAYIHQHNFFHRDVKPENILMDVPTETVRIADFGEARSVRARPPFTDYVGTRWYRAPECLLRDRAYSSPVDVWAAGLIFAELLRGSAVFCGSSSLDQLYRICQVLGIPGNDWPDFQRMSQAIRFRPPDKGCGWHRVLPRSSPQTIQAVQDIAVLNPRRRPLARKCLEFRYFAQLMPSDRDRGEAKAAAAEVVTEDVPAQEESTVLEEPADPCADVAASEPSSAVAATIPTPPRTPPRQGSKIAIPDDDLDLDEELDKILGNSPVAAATASVPDFSGVAAGTNAHESRENPSRVDQLGRHTIDIGPTPPQRSAAPTHVACQAAGSRAIEDAGTPSSPGGMSVDALLDDLCADFSVGTGGGDQAKPFAPSTAACSTVASTSAFASSTSTSPEDKLASAPKPPAGAWMGDDVENNTEFAIPASGGASALEASRNVDSGREIEVAGSTWNFGSHGSGAAAGLAIDSDLPRDANKSRAEPGGPVEVWSDDEAESSAELVLPGLGARGNDKPGSAADEQSVAVSRCASAVHSKFEVQLEAQPACRRRLLPRSNTTEESGYAMFGRSTQPDASSKRGEVVPPKRVSSVDLIGASPPCTAWGTDASSSTARDEANAAVCGGSSSSTAPVGKDNPMASNGRAEAYDSSSEEDAEAQTVAPPIRLDDTNGAEDFSAAEIEKAAAGMSEARWQLPGGEASGMATNSLQHTQHHLLMPQMLQRDSSVHDARGHEVGGSPLGCPRGGISVGSSPPVDMPCVQPAVQTQDCPSHVLRTQPAASPVGDDRGIRELPAERAAGISGAAPGEPRSSDAEDDDPVAAWESQLKAKLKAELDTVGSEAQVEEAQPNLKVERKDQSTKCVVSDAPEWSAEESSRLRRLVRRVTKEGERDKEALWQFVSSELGGGRSAKECKRQYAKLYKAHKAAGEGATQEKSGRSSSSKGARRQ